MTQWLIGKWIFEGRTSERSLEGSDGVIKGLHLNGNCPSESHGIGGATNTDDILQTYSVRGTRRFIRSNPLDLVRAQSGC